MKQLEEKTDKQALTKREKPNMIDLRKGEKYYVKGKETLDSMLTIQQANKRHISLYMVDKGQDKETAWATVVAVHPKSGQRIEDTVFFHFDSVKDLFLLEAIDSAEKYHKTIIHGYDPEGKPILSEIEQRKLIRRIIRFKHFSVREATTKATRRALLKMMNREWREDQEISYEEMEEEIVKNSIKDQAREKNYSSGTSVTIPKKNTQIIENVTELKDMPKFPEPSQDEKEFNENYQDFLLDESGGNNVFPPNSLKNLENIAKISPIEFLIRDSKYQGISYAHFQPNQSSDITQMTVTFGDKQRITIFLNRKTGEFWAAKKTKEMYGDFKVPYATATGYGKNWWFGPETTYKTIKEMKAKKKQE